MDDALTKIRKQRGLIARMARELCITSPAITKWKRVPAERVLEVERITGISRHELREDLYPREGAPQ